MPEGGKVTVRTENVEVTEEDCLNKSYMHPGFFIRLSVEDTGTGMDEKTQQRIFEPFFTTKNKGQGTILDI